MNPVLLTGATGFIGQRLQKALLADKVPVTAIIRPESRNRHAVLQGATSLLSGLDDKASLVPALRQAAAVIYCAGSVRGRTLDDFREANILGVRSIVEAMNDSEAEIPLLLISSLAASRPNVSDYARSKYLGEQEVVDHASFPWTIFRPPAVYGPGDREMLPILKLARKGLVTPPGPPGQRLSLIHVDDVASAAVAWLENPARCDQQVFTLDDGKTGGYGWRDIAETVGPGSYRRINVPAWVLFAAGHLNLALSRIFNYAPMLTPGKARELTQDDWVCNNKALSRATGWTPEIDLENGVHSLFESGSSHPANGKGDFH